MGRGMYGAVTSFVDEDEGRGGGGVIGNGVEDESGTDMSGGSILLSASSTLIVTARFVDLIAANGTHSRNISRLMPSKATPFNILPLIETRTEPLDTSH